MIYETQYSATIIERDNGERLVYALTPDGRIVPLHTPHNEEAAHTNNLRSFAAARCKAVRPAASSAQLREALPLAA